MKNEQSRDTGNIGYTRTQDKINIRINRRDKDDGGVYHDNQDYRGVKLLHSN
jgi:hypothetical protein